MTRTEHIEALLTALQEMFDQAVTAHDPSDPRHPSHGGQHTNGRCCEFGNLNPSAVVKMRWWAREMRRVLDLKE